jgi:hypothetical protein
MLNRRRFVGLAAAAIGHFRRYTQPGLSELVVRAGYELDGMLTRVGGRKFRLADAEEL